MGRTPIVSFLSHCPPTTMAPDKGAGTGSPMLTVVPKGLKTEPESTRDPERTGDQEREEPERRALSLKKRKKEKKCKWLKHIKKMFLLTDRECELKQCWDIISHLSFATYLEKKNPKDWQRILYEILSFLDNGKAKWYSLYKGELAISQKFSFSYWSRNPTFKYLSPPKITKYEKLYPYFAKYKLALFGIAKTGNNLFVQQ